MPSDQIRDRVLRILKYNLDRTEIEYGGRVQRSEIRRLVKEIGSDQST